MATEETGNAFGIIEIAKKLLKLKVKWLCSIQAMDTRSHKLHQAIFSRIILTKLQ